MDWDWIEKLLDQYSRIARLYPAVLATAPAIWTTVALDTGGVESISHGAMFVVVAAGVLYLFTSIARSRGKHVEPKLLEKWGGWATTALLRHRNTLIDSLTKARYHEKLGTLCGLSLPSVQEEANEPRHADDIYRSATKKLIELRRGPEYSLVHSENASYGFRRNLFGLKPVATAIALVAAGASVSGWWLKADQPDRWQAIINLAASFPEMLLLGLLNIGYAGLWLWIVRESFVFQAASDYALALLRTLDQPT